MLTRMLYRIAAAAADRRREEGGVVIEYGIVVAVIVLALITAGQAVVDAVATFFGRIPAGLPAP